VPGARLPLIDIRVADGAPVAHDGFRAAMGYLAERPEFLQLVVSELRFVAFTRLPRETVSVELRAYTTPLVGHEGTSAFYLATRLIWASEFVRLTAGAGGKPVDLRLARDIASGEQLRFVESFGGGEWVEYLAAEHALDNDSISMMLPP
jgi:hypothetical protein